MKYLLVLLLVLASCTREDDPIIVCKHYCSGFLNTKIRIDTEPLEGGLYHCSCDNGPEERN